MLPPDLLAAIEDQISRVGTRAIAAASAELTDWYRAGRPNTTGFRMTPTHQLAYAAARMPATFAADLAVLQELHQRLPDTIFETHLDLCAGPGTAAWAVAELFGELQAQTLLERDPGFIQLGRSLMSGSSLPSHRQADWRQADLAAPVELPAHDLVTLSYGLGELSTDARRRLVEEAWSATGKAFVLIEPGTPAGYSTVIEARRRLIELGAPIAAPCPHSRECPLVDTDRWCHFAQRLSRTRLHRSAKGGELGYEDEKYSYLIATRVVPRPFTSRIIGTPRETKPAILLELCAPEGLEQASVARRDKEAYRKARRVRWGDAWPEEE